MHKLSPGSNCVFKHKHELKRLAGGRCICLAKKWEDKGFFRVIKDMEGVLSSRKVLAPTCTACTLFRQPLFFPIPLDPQKRISIHLFTYPSRSWHRAFSWAVHSSPDFLPPSVGHFLPSARVTFLPFLWHRQLCLGGSGEQIRGQLFHSCSWCLGFSLCTCVGQEGVGRWVLLLFSAQS